MLTCVAKGAICADRDWTMNIASPTVIAVDSPGASGAFVGALSAQLAAEGNLLQADTVPEVDATVLG